MGIVSCIMHTVVMLYWCIAYGGTNLLGDRHVELVLGQVLDLAGLEAGDLPAHVHHARVAAHVGDVRPAVTVQLPPDGSEVQPVLHLHLLEVDLKVK